MRSVWPAEGDVAGFSGLALAVRRARYAGRDLKAALVAQLGTRDGAIESTALPESRGVRRLEGLFETA